MSALTFSSIKLDTTSTSAFNVNKANDSGNVFTVDTTNSKLYNYGTSYFPDTGIQVGSSTSDFGGATGAIISIKNVSVAPSSNPTGGSLLYSDSGNIKIRSSAGDVITLGSAASFATLSLTGTTDATNSSTGGTLTVPGGAAFAKKVYVGTDLDVTGTLTVGSFGFSSTTASTSVTTGAITLLGGIGINNSTDAVSSTNGGTFTTAGGIAAAKQIITGTNVIIGGTAQIATRINSKGYTLSSLTAGNPITTDIKVVNKRLKTQPQNATDTVSTWTSRTSAADNSWLGMTWSQELKLFIAVGTTGTGNRVMTSPYGITWTTRTSAADQNWKEVIWSPELSLLVAVAQNTTGTRVMTSPDAITWTSRTSAGDSQWNSVTWSPELSLFVAVGSAGTITTRSMYSSDGTNWTSGTVPNTDRDWEAVIWAAELGLFVATATAGATSGSRVMTSPDGINWTTRTTPNDNAWGGIIWSAELYLLVAVAQNGTGDGVMTSPDGITWTARAPATDTVWRSVTWSPQLSILVAVSGSGTGNRVMTSQDGITWTSRTSAADNNWRKVVWSPQLSIFAAISNSGTGNRIMTSSIGIPNKWSSVLISPAYLTTSETGGITYSGIFSSTSSTNSTSNSTGAITTSGGISSSNTTDATSSTNGGTITTAGGLAVAKKAFFGGEVSVASSVSGTVLNISPSDEDIIKQVSFSGANSVSSAANVTGLVFTTAKTRSFKIQITVVVVATASLYSQFEIVGVQNGSGWYLASSYVGDNSLVTFSITSGGQVQYTSATYSGFTSLTMKFRALTVSI